MEDLFEEKIKKAEEFTGYKFKNECLCVQAFVRKSFKYENTTYLIDNEILEFIGDSVLNAAITKRFAERYKCFGKIYDSLSEESNKLIRFYWACLNESELSELKIALVQKKTLAAAIEKSGLQNELLMGEGDIKNNIQNEPSVMEDLFEALLGAVALDCNWNMDIIESVVVKMLDPDALIESNFGDTTDYYTMFCDWYRAEYNGREPDIIVTHSEYEWVPYSCSLDLPAVKRLGFKMSGLGMTEESAKQVASKKIWKRLNEVLSMRKNALDTIGKAVPSKAVNQLQELWQKGIINKPEYEFEKHEGAFESGNPGWSCYCRIEGVMTPSQAWVCETKAEAKMQTAAETLDHLLNGDVGLRGYVIIDKYNNN